MRLAVFSDIHANFEALNAVINESYKYNIDHYILLGDYVGYYYEPKKSLGFNQKATMQFN